MTWASSVKKVTQESRSSVLDCWTGQQDQLGLGPCLSHGVHDGAEQSLNRQRPSPKTVLGAAGSHWGMQGTLLSSHAPIH